MPIPNNRVFLSTALGSGSTIKFLPTTFGDFAPLVAGNPVAQWLAGTADMNGDGRSDLIFGASNSDANGLDAGRVYVELGSLAGASTFNLGSGQLIIDGAHAGDHAGISVAGSADLNGDGRGEIIIGAPGVDVAGAVDAGEAYVVFGRDAGSINLSSIDAGLGGFAIRGEAAGDLAGSVVVAVGDMNGDGKTDFLVGAPGNDPAGALDAGAAYIVWGKDTTSPINLADVAAGIGGFKLTTGKRGDAIGTYLGTVGDMNGDGINEILVGSPNTGSGKIKGGTTFVVFGKANGTAVDLTAVAAGKGGGFAINGILGDSLGNAVTGIGDVNGDGLADMLVAAPKADHAYVVFGKAGTAAIDLNNVKAGIGGFEIVPEALKDLDQISVTGGKDLNGDGIADFVIGAPKASTNGTTTGAVYVVWGGGTSKVDLSLIAQSIGGAKISGTVDSLTGSSVAIVNDMNGDGRADLMIGAPGTAEGAYLLYSPATWQPEANIYGTNQADTIGVGYRSGTHIVGEGGDNIIALDGNDTIFTAGGNDTLDGGLGADSMAGGLGDDTYYVDNAGDVVSEAAGAGNDTVNTTISLTLGDNVENLVLLNGGLTGTGNALANHLTGSDGSDVLDGGLGADTMAGGLGDDTYYVDNAGDVVVEAAGQGNDTVVSSISLTLADNVENLTLAVSGLTGTGNGGANVITGTSGADTLDGGGGADTLVGGGGDDVYVVDNAGDVVVEQAGGGTDTVVATVDTTLSANVENLTLSGLAHVGTGNAGNNTITGTDGNDTLDGAAGADTLIGGLGDDTYHVDNAGDVIVEAPGAGNDTVIASVDYVLTEGAGVENLALAGTAHHATGNSGDNVITGGSGADVLDGGAGLDTLIGGDGNDTFVVDGHTDTIVESATGGTDTIVSSVDFSLTEVSNVENLTLTGDAHHATGNDGDNALTGGSGADLLEGGLGNDVLDGGAGADTMIGGAGDDTYIIDNPGDVVIETADGGNDTVIVNTDWVLADNIENVKLIGTGHALTGNAANNVLAGDTGNDQLDGGDGDDVEIGGDGSDVMISTSGSDTLVGGAGDDVYKVHGGTVHIEDFQGHDTIDASEAYGDSYIDLSGETQTQVEGHDVYYGNGGTVTGALNVQFLQDLTGSFADDIANVRTLVPQIVAALDGISGGAAFGVSSFRDKVWGSFGGFGDYTYQTDLAMGATAATLTSAYAGFIATGGADLPEAQLEALLQLAVRSNGEVGYQTNSARFVVLFTDAPFHTAADGTAAGITTANNGDAIINNGGIMENYPELAQLAQALAAANIIPIFAVTPGLEATYGDLATALGRGTVVTLTANSSNIVSAITTGLTTATTTHISDAIGGAGNDTLKGNYGANVLTGNAGDDLLIGGAGNDTLHGGDGNDTAAYSGAITDYTITHNADGTVTITDNRAPGLANEGTDTLDGVEFLKFGTTVYTISGTPVDGTNSAPTITSDGGGAAAAVSVAENTTAVTTVTATDPDAGTVLTYSISGGADAAKFAIDPHTGALSFVAAPNFEAPGDAGGDNVYDVEVTASDGALTSVQAIAVTVTNANDAPALTGAPATLAAGTEDQSSTVTKADLLAGFTDADGDTLSVSGLAANHGTVTDNGDGTYTIAPDANYNGPLVLSYAVTDGNGGSTPASLSLQIAPVNDPATIAGTATGDVLESGGTAGGTLQVSDVDAGEATFAAIDAAALNGTYGSFTFDAASGAWTYTVDSSRPATVALDPGQQVSETLTVSSLDGTAHETITVTVTGTSSPATISGTASGAVVEDGATGTGGTLTVTDGDAGQAVFAAVAPAALAGSYGAFAFDSLTGVWTYALDNAAAQSLGAGVQATESLTVASLDGSASQVITVTVTGVNDAATITGNVTGAVSEAGVGTAGTPSANGVLSVTDVDTGEAHFAALAPAALAGTYGSFAFDAATGAWSYTLDNARTATQALAAGATATESLIVHSADGTAQTITVTVTGANDAALIGGTASGSVTEANGTTGTSQVSGALTISDVDSSASFAAGAYAGAYGSLVLDAAGAWTYSLNNANPTVDALAAGSTLGDSVTVHSADGTTKVIAITINGVDDFVAGTTITGTAGADTLSGLAGSDQLFGLAGNDRLSGNGGNDTLDGGAGDDTLDGGTGTDTASYASATGSVAVSLLITGSQNTGSWGKDTLIGIENLTGSAFADTLIGNAGANAIDGGAGTDKITGGGGADILTGGLSNDTFIYTAASDSSAVTGIDTIRDFAHLGDRIDLSAIDALPGKGDDPFLWGNTTATAHGLWYSYDATANVTHLYADIDGNVATAEMQIDLAGNLALTAADFVL